MTKARVDLNWDLFADPPEEPETRHGAMLVNYGGTTARDTYDMVTSYSAAALRLLDAALKHGEARERS